MLDNQEDERDRLTERIGTAVRFVGLVVAVAGLIVGLVMVSGELGAGPVLAGSVVPDASQLASMESSLARPATGADESDETGARPGSELVAATTVTGVVDFERTEDTEYLVQEGETLGEIANRFDVPVETLARYNGLANPDRLHPLQRIVIPGDDLLPGARFNDRPE